ncbi:uncharacterized protein [Rutidosis leptorrhynchoides]|uniref:uncharacterized protein n=1 Tax=Rutidosis leptorrhynchoides TaxID=125765 RepID=UPI003A9A2629
MKTLLRELPTLTAPIAGETLMLYLTTSKVAISSILVADMGQMLVYFVTKALSSNQVNYPPIENLVYVLVHSARRLRTYFQAHSIVVFTDQPLRQGLACEPDGACPGLVLTSPDGEERTYALRFTFTMTNNESEYKALLSGMHIVHQLGIKYLDVYVDSQLVANQVNRSFEVHDVSMHRYMELVHELANEFDVFRLTQVPREQNNKADTLRKLAFLAFGHLRMNVWVEVLTEKSINEKLTVAPIEEENSNWMTPLVKFVTEGELPADEKEARKIHMKALMYALIKGCITGPPFTATSETYKGVPVLSAACIDNLSIVTPYDTNNHNMAIFIYIIIVFLGGIKFLVVAIDYFTKRVEAKALAIITSKRIQNFFWEDSVCRRAFQELVSRTEYQAVIYFSRPPAGNQGGLGLYGNEWVDELPSVFWEHHTTHKNSIGETPFSLVYGTEAVIPTELTVPTKRIHSFDELSNDEGMRANLGMLEECREIAAICEAINK